MNRYEQILTEHQAERDLLVQQKSDSDKRAIEMSQEIVELEEARVVVNSVLQATQITISDYIESVVSTLLQVVFGDSFSFKVVYELKRNQSEAHLYILEDGEMYEPKGECGVGALNVCALGLRIALWALSGNVSRKTFFLDEPAKCLSKDKLSKFGNVLKKCSEMLKVQLIVISHDPALIEAADRAFQVSKRNGISQVELC